jgi:hypothetical protein
MELPLVTFVEGNAVLCDVHEEIAAMGDAIVHFAERAHDKVDLVFQYLVDGEL